MVSDLRDGSFRFRVYLPHAAKVELVGTFTDWREHGVTMTREHPGWWQVELPVAAGEHQFCYLVDGGLWLADYAAHGVKLNNHGGWTSRLSVEAGRTTPAEAMAA